VRRGRLLLPAAALVFAAMAGCDRGTPTAAPTPTASGTATTTVGPGPTPTESVVTGSVTPTPTDLPLRLTEDQAAALLVDPPSLPTPYQVDPAVSPDARVGLPPGCPLLDAFGVALRTAPVRAARGFVGGQVGPYLEERVAVLPGRASEAVAQLARVATACRTFDSRDSDGVTVRFAVAPLPFPSTAEQSVAITMTGRPSQVGTLVTEVVAVRRGDAVLVFVHSGLVALDPTVVQQSLSTALETLARF
jgi:hypothetical protein